MTAEEGWIQSTGIPAIGVSSEWVMPSEASFPTMTAIKGQDKLSHEVEGKTNSPLLRPPGPFFLYPSHSAQISHEGWHQLSWALQGVDSALPGPLRHGVICNSGVVGKD